MSEQTLPEPGRPMDSTWHCTTCGDEHLIGEEWDSEIDPIDSGSAGIDSLGLPLLENLDPQPSMPWTSAARINEEWRLAISEGHDGRFGNAFACSLLQNRLLGELAEGEDGLGSEIDAPDSANSREELRLIARCTFGDGSTIDGRIERIGPMLALEMLACLLLDTAFERSGLDDDLRRRVRDAVAFELASPTPHPVLRSRTWNSAASVSVRECISRLLIEDGRVDGPAIRIRQDQLRSVRVADVHIALGSAIRIEALIILVIAQLGGPSPADHFENCLDYLRWV